MRTFVRQVLPGLMSIVATLVVATTADALPFGIWTYQEGPHPIRDDACTWHADTSTLALRSDGPVVDETIDVHDIGNVTQPVVYGLGLDRDPVSGNVVGCAAASGVQASAVRTLDVVVGSAPTMVWVRPGVDQVELRSTRIRATGERPGTVTIVLSYGYGAIGDATIDVRATSDGVDLDADGDVDVAMSGVPYWNVEIWGEHVSGRADLRAAPSRSSRPLRVFLGGDRDSVVLGPTSRVPLDVRTGPGNDRVTTADGADDVRTLGGDDVVNSGSGADRVMTGAGDDVIRAGAGADRVWSDSNAAYPNRRFRGDDRIHGGGAADMVQAGLGRDAIFGDAGNDSLFDLGVGRVVAGAGGDRVILDHNPTPRTISCGHGSDGISVVIPGRFAGHLAPMGDCERRFQTYIGAYGFGERDERGNHATRDDHNPTRYDAARTPFASSAHRSTTDCTWDPATGTVTFRSWGAGDAYSMTPIRRGMAASIRCGSNEDVPFTSIRTFEVRIASPRGVVEVSPGVLAALGDTVMVVHAPDAIADSSVAIVLDDDGDDPRRRYTIRSTPTGLDVDGDGTNDIEVHGPRHWNVHLDAPRIGGSFDLAAVPARRHERAWYDLAASGVVLVGPATSPDVWVSTQGTEDARRHSDDVITTFAGDDTVYAHGLDDVISTGDGRDLVLASTGDDRVDSGPGDDVVVGDYWTGRGPFYAGDDRIVLGPGDDVGIAGDGRDSMLGGSGRDQLHKHAGAGMVSGGPGPDRVGVNGTASILVTCGTGNDERDSPERGDRVRFVSCGRVLREEDTMFGRPWTDASRYATRMPDERYWN